MRVRQLSPTGDFTFGQSQANFLSNSPQAVAQIVLTSMQLWYGEWYIDTEAGMPWLEGVLGKYNQATADVTVQDYIRNIPNVTDISQYQSVENNRNYSASCTIDTTYGPTAVDVSNARNF